MSRYCILVFSCFLVCCSQASWYWPFGSDEEEEKVPPRVSELVAPASLLIDEAADLAANGQLGEAIAKYREALQKLDEVEAENPDRVQSPEFATFRNKRHLVKGKIDSLEHAQVQLNARPVVTSDTRDLQLKLERRRWEKYLNEAHKATSVDAARKAVSNALTYGTNSVLLVTGCMSGAAVLLNLNDPFFAGRLLLQSAGRFSMPTNASDMVLLTNALHEVQVSVEQWPKVYTNESKDVFAAFDVSQQALKELEKKMVKASAQKTASGVKDSKNLGAKTEVMEMSPAVKPTTKREQAIVDIQNNDFVAAGLLIEEALSARPNDALWMNLKAVKEIREGKLDDAEATLDQTIATNPRNYYAYYNMALLTLKKNPDTKDLAKRYYETGRIYGGPKDEALEALIK